LPSSSSIHPVFHVSQLKQAVGSNVSVGESLPFELSALQVPGESLPFELSALQVPEQVLQCRMVSCGLSSVAQVLVKWSNTPESLATWKDLEALQQRFLKAPAWGQVVFSEGDNVRAPKSLDGDEAGQLGLANGKRQRRPNKRVMGPKWICS
jgi:hypothetical protein